jgi:NADH-quinone oxidoreductase subunit N
MIIAITLIICIIIFSLNAMPLKATSNIAKSAIISLLLLACLEEGLLYKILFLDVAGFDLTDSQIRIILCVLGILSFIILLINRDTKQIENGMILTCLVIYCGYIIALMTETFFNMFLALEVAAFSSYALIGLNPTKLTAKEAGMKYFTGTTIAGVVFLLGASILYALTRTMNISQLADIFMISRNIVFYLGLLLIILSLSSKLAMAPFHLFTIDAYQNAPIFVSSYLMTIPKLALFFILYKIYSQFPSSILDLCLLILILITLIQQTVQAFGQTKFRRFIVFSMTVNNVIFFACLLIASTVDSFSIIPSLVFYFLPLILLFFVLAIFVDRDDNVKNLSLQKNPIMILGLFTSVVSSAGIPVLGGFLQKYFVLGQLVLNSALVYMLIIILVALLSGYYYLRVILSLFFTNKFVERFNYLMLDSLGRPNSSAGSDIVIGSYSFLIVINLILMLFQIQDLSFTYSYVFDFINPVILNI